MDTSLLRLGPRGAELTAAGRFWAREAAAVLDSLERAAGAFDVEFGQAACRLRIAAGKIVVDYLLPRWLMGWTSAKGGRSCDVEAGNSAFVAQSVLDARAELGFCEIGTAPPELTALPLVPDRLILVVAPSHKLARRRRPVSLDELAHLELVHREPGSGTQQMLNEVLTAQGLTMAHPGIQVDSITGLKTAAASGVAPAVVSALSVQDELASGALREVAIEGVDLQVWVKALFRRGSHLSRVGQSFLAHAQECSASSSHGQRTKS